MFAVESNADGIFNLLFNDRPVLSGCYPIVTLQDGHELEWDSAESMPSAIVQSEKGADAVYRISFRNAKHSISLLLTVECSAESVIARAAVHIPSSFHSRPLYLHPERSIRLTARDERQASGGILAHHITYRWWTGPAFPRSFADIPAGTQALLWKSGDNYIQALAGLSDRFVSSMRGTVTGLEFEASSLQSGCHAGEACLFVLAAHANPYEACRLAAQEGIRATGSVLPPKEDRSYPDMLEYLGFCSWDAFQREVSADALLAKAAEFRSKQVPIRWFLIDEGWLESDEEDRLISFRAEPRKFPDGLEPVVRKLKSEFGLAWVGVWHAITGYWSGIRPDSPLAREQATSLLQTSGGRVIPQPDAVRGFPFWHSWHGRLKQEGVDFVKADSQSTLNAYVQHDVPIGQASRGTHAALEASVGIHFGMRIINCGGMRTESIWSRPRSAVSRNSDDFVPKQEHSFRAFALQNVYNSLVHGQLYWGDWDMWWSDHPDAKQNALLRAVSGGPVYVSDAAGGTNAEALMPLILADGRILRCDGPGMPTEDLLFRNPMKEEIPLKVWNRSGDAGIVGAWNVNEAGKRVTGTIGAAEVPGLECERFAILAQQSGKVTFLDAAERMPITLEGQHCELFVIAPVRHGIAVFGSTDKYISPATIVMRADDAAKTTVLLKEGGILGFASERTPGAVRVGGEERECVIRNGLYSVPVSSGGLVEIWR